jgi:hypothetical protein
MKRPVISYSKKFLPLGSRRITMPDGTRAWIIGGRVFPGKRDYFEMLSARAQRKQGDPDPLDKFLKLEDVLSTTAAAITETPENLKKCEYAEIE